MIYHPLTGNATGSLASRQAGDEVQMVDNIKRNMVKTEEPDTAVTKAAETVLLSSPGVCG